MQESPRPMPRTREKAWTSLRLTDPCRELVGVVGAMLVFVVAKGREVLVGGAVGAGKDSEGRYEETGL